jgi:MoaA/NifB/PqqE/SkfB family radical SAM enzyme
MTSWVQGEVANRWRDVMRPLHRARRAVKLRFNRWRRREYITVNSFFSLECSGLCNLNCRFCGYGKKEAGRTVMPTATFARLIDEAVGIGYRAFGMTPMTGDIFMDKEIGQKFAVLENHPGVHSFWFYTNFVLTTPALMQQLAASRKLGPVMYISLYGHDSASFTRITQRPEIQFRRLVENLTLAHELLASTNFTLDIGFRTYPSFDWKPTPGDTTEPNPLLRALNRLFEHPHVRYSGNITEYSSWGGMIKQEDVADIGIEIRHEWKTPKIGACAVIFDRPTVFADGKVNACVCHGLDRSLVIGDTRTAPLRDIMSLRNPALVELIRRQQAGDFPTPCQDCKFYRSIYRKPRGEQTVTLAEYTDMMASR